MLRWERHNGYTEMEKKGEGRKEKLEVGEKEMNVSKK